MTKYTVIHPGHYDAFEYEASSPRQALELWAKGQGFPSYQQFCEEWTKRPEVMTSEHFKRIQLSENMG